MSAQPISPSDILPFVEHINRLRSEGWTFSLCHMYDWSQWHVVFTHEATRKANRGCHAHGYGEALRDAMKQAIARASDPSQWRLVQDRPDLPPEQGTRVFDL